MAVVYENPETGERRHLAIGGRNETARQLEEAGWVLKYPLDFDPWPPEAPEESESDEERDGEEVSRSRALSESELVQIEGISTEIAQALRSAGLETRDELDAASDEELLAISGIGEGRLAMIREALT
jgi:predicted flap endonuclease-1-like 5' DNA nuclease